MTTATVVDEQLLAFATEVGSTGPIAVEGCRTRWSLGGPLDGEPRLVSAPAGIVEHIPEEMIVRVRAGELVSDLAATLAAVGQRCALPERGGTVGGALAVGENHLERLGRGPVRDSVLQVRYVSAEGRVITGGGPTVKNVSGFDLPRILVGSLGTIGLIGEIILRTNPIPAVQRWVRSDEADPFAVRSDIRDPGAILWDGATTWVLVEGHAPDVDADLATLGATARWDDTPGPPPTPVHRWGMRPRQLRDLGESHAPFVASIGVGTVFRDEPQPQIELDAGIALISARLKAEFDPQGRLNPGRVPGRGAGPV